MFRKVHRKVDMFLAAEHCLLPCIVEVLGYHTMQILYIYRGVKDCICVCIGLSQSFKALNDTLREEKDTASDHRLPLF